MRSMSVTDAVRVVVVGAGPAGLAASRALTAARVPHLVLERERVAWSWRAQRWDSFRLNTPGWANRAPGEFLRVRPTGFASARCLVDALEQLARALPVCEGVEVFSARRDRAAWQLHTSDGVLRAETVVVASGFQNVPVRPGYAHELPAEIRQLHAADYRHPGDIEDGVLVVGGGQSGVQIAEDLLDAGKRVYLATSRVGRMPRRFHGRDASEWLRDSGQLDLPATEADAATIAATPPQVSGAAGGRTVSYQALADRGATLLGRAVGWDGERLELARDLGENVRFADEAAASLQAAWTNRAQLMSGRRPRTTAPDHANRPAPALYAVRGPASLYFSRARVSTVIWATGFAPSLGWLPEGALDARHKPRLPGLRVIGAPWLTHRSSANLYGMVTDAAELARALTVAPATLAA